jgi:branched-chain amino acid transport system permease protein
MRMRGEAALRAASMLGLALVPPMSMLIGEPFYIDLLARVMIFAIAAVSLNFILGFGGMASFGHAAFLGVGAYVVGLLIANGLTNGYLHLLIVVVVSALIAAFIGAVCLRTSGLYFIMITLAFAQFLYFVGVGLKQYGGDDGFTIRDHSDFGAWIPLSNDVVLYYLIWAVLALCLFLIYRLVASRFGMALRGTRSNERRMRSIGLPTYRYKLAAFVISGVLCAVAGALLANLTQFVSPAYMHWTRSGELLIMVIMGGMSSVFGPVLGATVYLLLEEGLSSFTEHWQAILGPILVLIVLFARNGLTGFHLTRRSAQGGSRHG